MSRSGSPPPAGWLRVRNWERWQTYRVDRTPPWIKLHRGLLLNPEWQCLTDAEKGALVSIWMLAGERNGRIPDDPLMVRKLAQLEITPDLDRFLSLQFLEKITKRRRRGKKEHVALDVDVDVEERRGETTAAPAARSYPSGFEEAWAAYPKRGGDNPKPRALKAWDARRRNGATEDEMLEGVHRYAAFCESTDKIGTEFVKQAATFFGPDEHFREAWEIPRRNGNGQRWETPHDRINRLCADDADAPGDERGETIEGTAEALAPPERRLRR